MPDDAVGDLGGRTPLAAHLLSMTGMSHAVALAVVLAAAVALRLAWRKLFVRNREPRKIDRWLAEYTATPVFLLIIAVGADVIFARLAALPEVQRLPVTPYVTGLTYILTRLSITWVVYGVLRGISGWYFSQLAPKTGSALDNELLPAFGLAVKVLLIFIAAVVILNHYNVELKTLLATAGAASLVLALAAQDTLGNMFAGFSIMVDRPFRLGDRIDLSNGRLGDVQEIGLRSTRILSPDNTMLIIPNSEIAKSSVINHSYPDEKLHVRQKLSVPYGNDVSLAKRIVAEVCREHPLVLVDPAPQAMLGQLGDALQINFHFWLASFRQQGKVLDEVNVAIYERLEQAGIKLVTAQYITVTNEAQARGPAAAEPESLADDQVRSRAG